jgi:hypothetical protein
MSHFIPPSPPNSRGEQLENMCLASNPIGITLTHYGLYRRFTNNQELDSRLSMSAEMPISPHGLDYSPGG